MQAHTFSVRSGTFFLTRNMQLSLKRWKLLPHGSKKHKHKTQSSFVSVLEGLQLHFSPLIQTQL